MVSRRRTSPPLVSVLAGALDTNMRSWSDETVQNVRSMPSTRDGARRHLRPGAPVAPGTPVQHGGTRRARCEAAARRPDGLLRPAATGTAPDREWDTGPTGAGGRRWRPYAVAAAFAVALVALALPWGGTGRPPYAPPGAAQAGQRLVAHATYVVQPGDTLWSIASRLAPAGDPRVIVSQLESEAGGVTIFPGEHLRLP